MNDKLKEIINNNKYNLIVLEEFNIALRDNFIEEDLLLTIIKELNKKIIESGKPYLI